MRIAIASGKGGTGKTSLSVLLAQHMAQTRGTHVTILDCDCDAPNAHLFFGQIEVSQVREVTIPTPRIDLEKCTFCGDCTDICRFNAIAVLGHKVAMTFNELCHGCKGCFRVCKAGAIAEEPRVIGHVLRGRMDAGSSTIELVQGRLRIGEAMSPPLIKAVLDEGSGRPPSQGPRLEIVDSPPGTSCPVVASVHGAHHVILVSEPTPFGLHDLEGMAKVLEGLGLDFSVVGNKVLEGGDAVEEFCLRHGYSYLGGLPFSHEFAARYAKGGDLLGLVRTTPQYKEVLCRIEALTSKR